MHCYDWEATHALSKMLLCVQKVSGQPRTVVGLMAVYTCTYLTKCSLHLLYTTVLFYIYQSTQCAFQY